MEIKKLTPLKILAQVQSSRPPKGNSLCKNTSYDVQIVKIGPPFFTAHPFTQSPNHVLRCFLIGHTLPKVPFPVAAPISPCNTCSLDPSHSAFQTASRSVRPFSHRSRQSLYFTIMGRRKCKSRGNRGASPSEFGVGDANANCPTDFQTRMWANAQPDGRPAEHRWRPLFNAAKFG